MKAAATDAGSSSAAPSLDLASRLTENAEIVSECLAVLQQLVPQLSAEERVLVCDHTLFGLTDAPGNGGLRVGLGPPDMPARLARLEAAIKRYVNQKELEPARASDAVEP